MEYCARLPRILPKYEPNLGQRDVGHPERGHRARWDGRRLAEIYMWMSAVAFAVVGWRYDARLLLQCVLVSLGVSLVARGALTGRGPEA